MRLQLAVRFSKKFWGSKPLSSLKFWGFSTIVFTVYTRLYSISRHTERKTVTVSMNRDNSTYVMYWAEQSGSRYQVSMVDFVLFCESGNTKERRKNKVSGNRSRVLVGRTRTKFAEANQHKSQAMHEKYEEAAIRTIMEDTYASHSSSLTLCYVGFVLSVLHAQRHY